MSFFLVPSPCDYDSLPDRTSQSKTAVHLRCSEILTFGSLTAKKVPLLKKQILKILTQLIHTPVVVIVEC